MEILRKIFIIKDGTVLYSRTYGNAMEINDFLSIFKTMEADALSSLGEERDSFDYYKYKISYLVDKSEKIFYCFISDITDDINKIYPELERIKSNFEEFFLDIIKFNPQKSYDDNSIFESLNPIVDTIHRNLKPKISLVGYSGVGKTTITRLIKFEEIPTQHIPTIHGEVSTIKIGNLHFLLWDFAGQEQFSFLWNKFIKGSDAVLVITDSTLENIEKSQLFLELIKQEAPFTHVAIIGNKQDLPNVLAIHKIEELMGHKAYAMIAIDQANRDKMIQIIADLLDMNTEISPLLEPLIKRDRLITEAEGALMQLDFENSSCLFEEISNLCLNLGDDSLSKEFYEKSQKIKEFLKNNSKIEEGNIV